MEITLRDLTHNQPSHLRYTVIAHISSYSKIGNKIHIPGNEKLVNCVFFPSIN